MTNKQKKREWEVVSKGDKVKVFARSRGHAVALAAKKLKRDMKYVREITLDTDKKAGMHWWKNVDSVELAEQKGLKNDD